MQRRAGSHSTHTKHTLIFLSPGNPRLQNNQNDPSREKKWSGVRTPMYFQKVVL